MDLIGEFCFLLESKKHGRASLVLYGLRGVGCVHALEVEFVTLDKGMDLSLCVGALDLDLGAQIASFL